MGSLIPVAHDCHEERYTRQDETSFKNRHTHKYCTTQYVHKSAGWAGIRVSVCRALVMANYKCGYLLTCKFVSLLD